MTDITKFKNVSLSKKTYSDVGVLSKEIFDVPLSLSKTIEYLVEKEIKIIIAAIYIFFIIKGRSVARCPKTPLLN